MTEARWPIWKNADPVLKEAVLFLHNNWENMGADKAIKSFHKKNKVATSLSDFLIDVENLYYAPTTIDIMERREQ